ncbi:ATP-binding protein [Myxococcus sp. RHSTA-1-4]|uniref:sensor histidine kinase n=1 Tax=Myxococcus sp. RHSTA-1-4 TaxID=2874601 RepID=UPI001CBCF1D9|nr:ATP-binding protein [Myxococcus sp. RHSTA-1-4]MBZ4421055.1 PAS domain S-box protein [Myxococcus sp. RHSTA-1-4]
MTAVSTDPADYRLLEGLPIPVSVVRGERVRHVNAAFASLLGTTREELLSTPLLELIARYVPEERGWLEPMYESVSRGEPHPEHPRWLRVRRADGQERTVQVWHVPGLTPEDTVVLVQDMEGEHSVRRLTGALVAAAAEMMRCRDEQSVLETAVDAIHRQGFYVSVMRLDGDVFRHGPMRQEAASVAEAERLYGMPMGDVRIPSAAVPHYQEVLQRRRAAFHPDFFAVVSRIHPPEVVENIRKLYPPESQGLDAPILVEGRPYGVLSVQGTTLTPAGAGTLELFSQLLGGALENVHHHQTVAERLEEVSRLQEELVARERLTVLGEAAGVVAHEVRNPLGAILNAVAVLRREAHLGPTGQAAVGMLEEEVIRLEDIVKDLLDVVRPLEPRPRPVSVGELVRRALGQLHGPPDAPTLRFVVDEAPDTPAIEADETLLQLAVTHLVRNAVQASPSGGRVRMAVAPMAGGVCLVVEDEGPGIPNVDPARVFEPFFLTRANGRGLGLAIVRRVVLAHGGTVRAMGRPEGGARFEVHLPLEPSRRSPA